MSPTGWSSRLRLVIAALLVAAVGAVSAALLVTGADRAASLQKKDPSARISSPIGVWMPASNTTYVGTADGIEDAIPTIIAGPDPFVVTLRRSAWTQPIVATWKSRNGDVILPSGVADQFWQNGLRDFVTQTVRGPGGKSYTATYSFCPFVSKRSHVDAAATNRYPDDCPRNPYTNGQVIGLPAGWRDQAWGTSTYDLPPGTYSMTTRIAPRYREMFGISAREAKRVTTLQVVPGTKPADAPTSSVPTAKTPKRVLVGPKAHAARPTSPATKHWRGPRPDLVALPAHSIYVKRDQLHFAATVYNAGKSRLLVDGFKRSPGVMDAYQYFFDQSGKEAGYVRTGDVRWDRNEGNWGSTGVARLELRNADRKTVRSSEPSACGSVSDPIDFTLPNANWLPEFGGYAEGCNYDKAKTLRADVEVGSGETYEDGGPTTFDLRGLPNGSYYLAVTANPMGTLIESDTTNNVALRKIVIGGKPGARTVTSEQIGRVTEPDPRQGDDSPQ